MEKIEIVYCATPSRMRDKVEEILDFVQGKGLYPFHVFLAFPHQRFEDNPAVGREKAMKICLRTIDFCDRFWLFGISEGTTLIELEYVLVNNLYLPGNCRKPIEFYFQLFDPRWEEMLKELEEEYHPRQPVHVIKYIREKLREESR